MIARPQCKINLGLRVLRSRPDGYRDISTVLYPLPFSDLLEIIPAPDGVFRFSAGGIPVPGPEEENLVVKACRLMESTCGAGPVHIHLHKAVPMGSGLGGGSADAAACLNMMNTLFDLNVGEETLKALAARLGSDCPFFIRPVPSLASGRGDLLEPLGLDLSGYHLVLVFPGIHISTAEAYKEVKPSAPAIPLTEVIADPVSTWKDRLVNDFEDALFPSHPVLKSVRDGLYQQGAAYAAMTGSGSALFGLFGPGQEGKAQTVFFPGCHHRVISC